MNRVERIISGVADEHGISIREILGSRRHSEVATARRAVAVKLIDDLNMTYAAAGRVLNRDPSWICKMVKGVGA